MRPNGTTAIYSHGFNCGSQNMPQTSLCPIKAIYKCKNIYSSTHGNTSLLCVCH